MSVAIDRWGKTRVRLRDLDSRPGLVKSAKALRRFLPGDDDYGDPLSVGGSEPPHLIGQRLAAMTAERPSALREAGLSAVQVWQALSEKQGRGRGDEEMAILFTDLVGFSSWALEAGDDQSLKALREIDAVTDARERLERVEVAGFRPLIRAGLHTGRPQVIGGDYLGVDVNVAARLMQKAGPGETLVSQTALTGLDAERVNTRRKKSFAFGRVKGVPDDLAVYVATPRLRTS